MKIKEMDALNTSDHTLVLATVGVDVKRAAPLYLQLKALKSSWSCSHFADESRHNDGKYVMPERLNCWLASQLWW
jgi:hypothetical protein